MNKQRLEAERLIYQVFDQLDPSQRNTDYWKELFADMSDEQFKKYISGDFPFYFQTGAFKEPTMDQINKSLKLLNVPLLESVYMPFKYKDKNGNPMKTKPCMVVYIHMKRMKQILTKKNGMSISTKSRDMRTGLLTGIDKNGKESDHEFESLAISGLYNTMKEFSRPRADAMEDKSIMNNTIKNTGIVYEKDLPEDINDSLSKNLLSTYFIGAQLMSNLVNIDYMVPFTYLNKNKKIERID
jgi:hypothetical protein